MYGSYLWTLFGNLLLGFLLYFQDSGVSQQGTGSEYLFIWSSVFIYVLLLFLLRLLSVNLPFNTNILRLAETLILAFAPREILYFLPLVAWGTSLKRESWWAFVPLIGMLIPFRHGLQDPLTLALVLVLYIFALAFDGSLGRLQKHQQDELEAKLDLRETRQGQEQMKRQLTASLVDTEYQVRREEREGLSRELHDILGHSLSATLMQVAAIRILNKQEDLAPLLEEVQTALDRGLKQTRETLHELHAESFSLRASIETVTSAWNDVRVTLDLSSDVDDLPIQVRYDLWAIIQESLTNFMRHSKNDSFSIRLRVQPAFYSLVIEDYPIDEPHSEHRPVPISDGMGMRNMRQIAFKYQGHLNAQRIGKGYILRVILYRERT